MLSSARRAHSPRAAEAARENLTHGSLHGGRPGTWLQPPCKLPASHGPLGSSRRMATSGLRPCWNWLGRRPLVLPRSVLGGPPPASACAASPR
eukprot:10910176-Alexandrium_andersonii.AAC.1